MGVLMPLESTKRESYNYQKGQGRVHAAPAAPQGAGAGSSSTEALSAGILGVLGCVWDSVGLRGDALPVE